ncbi:cupin domain-containing protein [Algoriphagus halophilus]|uniref:Cupin superfamily protein n=1 Tax=Algoriphagus halophilus TaxID=226505 RepID=A0A1N6D6G8_9BACT|nr:cupin domain-containing protein [Algoriphagus halophilus]SIN66418.1 Cupin superfamily protein [Algoriphagus halophilus]
MNSNLWERFLQDTSKLAKPAQAKQLISESEIDSIQELLIEVLRGFLAKQDIHIGLKVYINKELKHEYLEKMIAHPPGKNQNLEQWSKEIFGDQKFGMILIGLEEYSNAFAEKAAEIVRPLLQQAGMPLNGLSFLFFMGNYGFTPFGIHKESTGEDGILFHLGPGLKNFYTWDDPKYNGIAHNSEVFHNIQEMMDSAEEYQLKPGDAMFIPHDVYHVADTPDFSMSFVLDYINPPVDQLENELLQLTAEENFKQHVGYGTPVRLEETNSFLRNRIDIESIGKKLEKAFERKITALKSNGGIRRKSNLIQKQLPISGNFSIQGKRIFPILLDETESERILLFARGHRIHFKKNPGLSVLVEKLNSGEWLTFDTIQELLLTHWDLIDIYGFIQDLLNTEAIQLKN